MRFGTRVERAEHVLVSDEPWVDHVELDDWA